MKKIILGILLIVMCVLLMACNSTEDATTNNDNNVQIEQEDNIDNKDVNNEIVKEESLYEKYAGIYMVYSIESDEKMYYVNEIMDGELLSKERVVIEIYESKNGKLVILHSVINFTYAIVDNKINIKTNSELDKNIQVTINENMLYFKLTSDGNEIIIRLRKEFV